MEAAAGLVNSRCPRGSAPPLNQTRCCVRATPAGVRTKSRPPVTRRHEFGHAFISQNPTVACAPYRIPTKNHLRRISCFLLIITMVNHGHFKRLLALFDKAGYLGVCTLRGTLRPRR